MTDKEREQLESLTISGLKTLGKSMGIKGYTTMDKEELKAAIIKKRETEDASAKKEESTEKPAEKEPARAPKEKASVPEAKKEPEPEAKKETVSKKDAEGKKDFEAKKDADLSKEDLEALDSKVPAKGILEVMQDGFGFIRCENYLPGEHDVYVAPSQIRRFGLKTGDIIEGSTKIKTANENFSAL